jgi:putative DNA primase/helicase
MAGNLESWVDLANEYFDIAPEYRDLGALYAAVTHSFRYCVRLGEKREEDAKLDLWPRIPYLAINAPTEGAGKSNLALLMEFTVMNAIRGSGSTSATIVRDCGARWPLTLITDDVDSQNDADPARWASICSLSNLGFKYDTRGVQEKVTLGAGKEKRTEMVTKYFSVFYPKIFSGIKLKDHLPRPTWSRCLSINMQVSSMASNFERDEPRIKIRGHKLRGRMAQLARRFNTMAGSIIAEDVPELANNPRMARQLAPPLLSVAMLAGSDWEARAAKALIYVDANTPKRIDTNRLLVCDLWERGFAKYSERLNPRFLLSTDGAISHLIEMNGRPWATWHKGRPISPQSLSDQLAEWQCAPSRHYDVDGRRKRGLLSSAVKAAYDRASKGMDLDDGDVEHRE